MENFSITERRILFFNHSSVYIEKTLTKEGELTEGEKKLKIFEKKVGQEGLIARGGSFEGNEEKKQKHQKKR